MWKVTFLTWLVHLQIAKCGVAPGGILYPRDSETRQTVSLDGVWNFVLSPINDPLIGFRELWFKKDITKVFFFSYTNIYFICQRISRQFLLIFVLH